MSDFRQRLSEPGIIITDGATGTMLQYSGLPAGTAPERWNLERPEAVCDLHRSYIEAGSEMILTNTFGGSRLRLEKSRLGEQT